jgi:hypothetical protein
MTSKILEIMKENKCAVIFDYNFLTDKYLLSVVKRTSASDRWCERHPLVIDSAIENPEVVTGLLRHLAEKCDYHLEKNKKLRDKMEEQFDGKVHMKAPVVPGLQEKTSNVKKENSENG